MSNKSYISVLASLFFAMALLFSGCAKDELVEPLGTSTQRAVNAFDASDNSNKGDDIIIDDDNDDITDDEDDEDDADRRGNR